MIGESLKEKLKISCHKNPIQNVVIDWLLNGNVDEKNDANTIIFNANSALELVNGLNHQINPNFEKPDFYEKINSMIYDLLTSNDDFSSTTTRNRKNIETRGWLVTAFAHTLPSEDTRGIDLLKTFLDNDCDRKVTKYWSLISILYFYRHFKGDEKRDFVNEYYSKIALDSKSDIQYDRIYWLFSIWYINDKPELDNNNHLEDIINRLTKSDLTDNYKDNNILTELFASLSFKPCVHIVKELQKFVDDIIEKDLVLFWEERDIHMFKYLIFCLSQYGEKEHKKTIGDAQVNLYYKIFKLLSISRSYSSRVWNQIKQQLLKALRIYYRTTGKKLLDELREELMDSDLSIVFEACKTLKSIHDIDRCLEIIIKVLYTQSEQNIDFEEKKIFAVSYSLKLLSLKDSCIINKLQEVEQGYDNYNKKNIVRKLFIEMGGIQAIKKSQMNADIREKYMTMTCNAQGKVETMFQKSISDAKRAFKISLVMNIIVFMVGIILLMSSGIIAISNDSQDKWAGIGVSSGTGFLSLIYSLFINKPSRKIRKNTNHLMRLKVIFLGYLRELTQMDQSFSKSLLDSDIITTNTLESFVSKIKNSMNNALTALRWEELLNNKLTPLELSDITIGEKLEGNYKKTLIDSINNSNISDEEFNKITEYLESLDDNKESDKPDKPDKPAKTGIVDTKKGGEHTDNPLNMENTAGNLILNIKPKITSV